MLVRRRRPAPARPRCAHVADLERNIELSISVTRGRGGAARSRPALSLHRIAKRFDRW